MSKNKKANPLSRFALGVFVAGASAYLLKKNEKKVEEGVDRIKEKAEKVKDEFLDVLNSKSIDE